MALQITWIVLIAERLRCHYEEKREQGVRITLSKILTRARALICLHLSCGQMTGLG